MVSQRVVPHVSDLRRRFENRVGGLVLRDVRDRLISLAGVLSGPVLNQRGEQMGDLVDVVTNWAGGEVYPAISGLVVRVGRRRVFVPSAEVASIGPKGASLSSARLDLREFAARDGEVSLVGEVLDHELIDLDGASVIRASDLYLALVAGCIGWWVSMSVWKRSCAGWGRAVGGIGRHRAGWLIGLIFRRWHRKVSVVPVCRARLRRYEGCVRRNWPRCWNACGAMPVGICCEASMSV